MTIGAQFVLPLSLAGTAVALPAIARDLGSQPESLQFVVNGFNVCFALFTIVWGRLSDRVGYRRALQAGMALMFTGSVLSSMADSLLMLDIARVIAGIGAASVLTGSATIISHTYSGTARTRAFTAFGAVSGFGLASGPMIAGATVGLVGWRGVFVLHAALMLLALAGSPALPPGRHENTGSGPLLDLSILRNEPFMRMALVPVAGAIGFVALITYLPSAFEAVHGWSTASSGALMMVMTGPVFLSPLIVHHVTARFPWITPGKTAAIALVCLVLGPLGLLTVRPEASPWLAVVPMLLCGLGFGLPLGFVDGEALAAVPAERAGTAAGLFNLLRIGAEALFVAAFGATISTLVARRLPDPAVAERVAAGEPGHPADYTASLSVALLGAAVLSAVLLWAYLALSRRIAARRRPVADVDLVPAAPAPAGPQTIVDSYDDRTAECFTQVR
ncbi:MFS transporter [Micromonospora rifamycinica]|uniref:MFS transporter n=1 Tax=Micromonospora rifamycinica TaxID=291594 RepID=UPI0034164139